MKEKLTLEHMAPYLPYKLKGFYKNTKSINYELESLANDNCGLCNYSIFTESVNSSFKNFKPLLHPLSKLTQEIEHNGEKLKLINFIPEYCFEYHSRHVKKRLFDNEANTQAVIEYIDVMSLSYSSMLLLFKYHFDVFGLIEKGLAIEKQ